jgi:hypothetical protein
MDESNIAELRKMAGRHEKLVYEEVKAGKIDRLPPETRIFAKAIQEHMQLKHVHNALEFADLRDGEQYEVEVEGNIVNPMAHVAMHAAVKGQLEKDPLIKDAFERMVATGTTAHHAEHVLIRMLVESQWKITRAIEAGEDAEKMEKIQKVYFRNLQKLIRDSAYRRNLVQGVTADHDAFE